MPLAAGDNSELTAEGSLVNVSRGGSELHELVRAGDVEGIQALKASSSDAEWERALCSRDDDTVCVCVCVCACVRVCVRTCVHTELWMYAYVQARTRTNACTHVCENGRVSG